MWLASNGMDSSEIRKRFLKFFEERGHAVIPSSSLVPEHDPTVLFTTAGMQPLIPYLLGEKHPQGNRLVNVQKCVRTQDIDEVGDKTHDTFFEMLGNWSLGDYFKKDAIKWSYEFLTDKKEGLGLDPDRLYITCFEGNNDAPKDNVSAEIWASLGIPENRIYFLGAKDNWWSPGDNGPCGPDTEMFYDITENGLGVLTKEEFIKADKDQNIVEIWNDVFMEYQKKDGKVIGKLKQQNVDTGAGLERLAMVMQVKDNIFDTDLFSPVMSLIKSKSTSYEERSARIVADHVRTSIFMIDDGVVPSNTDRGYILRRLIRRSIMESKHLGVGEKIFSEIISTYSGNYKTVYSSVSQNLIRIQEVLDKESEQFVKTLTGAIKKLWTEYFYDASKNESEKMNAEVLFHFFTTEGFPPDLTLEEYRRYRIEKKLYPLNGKEVSFLMKVFNEKMGKHQETSRAGAEQKFKGGLMDHSPQSIKYHTATHLLHKALREVLGNHVFQKGSNITPDRLRFDFSFERKMTDEEKKKVEDLVNTKIKEAILVTYEDLPLEEAEKKGAIGLFEEKYGDKVRVYKIGDFSLEFCGGPHVKNTSELGEFKISKEEAVSAGVRRIKAVLEISHDII